MVSSAASLFMRAMSSLRMAALVLALAAVVMSGAFEMSGTPCIVHRHCDNQCTGLLPLDFACRDLTIKPMAYLMPHRSAYSATGYQPSRTCVPNLQ